jgi:hypothetical protein
VVRAMNADMPFDQFTVEQLAGDLLPNATLDQKIATGFNRNHPINFEGGAIPEEYQAAYIFDRIDTTTTTWMALTMRCTQCHDHKYDPLTQKDFYRFYAFFNNVPENGLDGQGGNAAPFIKAPTPQQQAQLAAYDTQIAGLDAAVKARAATAATAQAEWEKTAPAAELAGTADGLAARFSLDEASGEKVQDATGLRTAGQVRGKAEWADGKLGGALRLDGTSYVDLGPQLDFDRGDHFSYGAWVYPTSGDAMTVLSRMDDNSKFRGWDLYLAGGKAFVHMIHEWEGNALRVNTKTAFTLNQWHHLFVTYDGSSKAKGVHIYVDGKPADLDVTHDALTDTIRTPTPLLIGRRNPGAPFKGMIDEVRAYSRDLSAAEVEQMVQADTLRPILAVPAEKRTPEQRDALSRYFLATHDEKYAALSKELADMRQKRGELDKAIPTTMVMEELPKPRDTFVLIRGAYDKKGEQVEPGTPAVLPPLPAGMPANRLALAKWLVSPENPLTARVAVNRYWQMYFGTGLVKTAENFGTQGERPSHPELLDWLATEFMRTGWDVKAMQRLIVTSATYQQSSKATKTQTERDPENRLLDRGPRQRLTAEMVRDQALAVSGLLVDKLGGPSVKPYQPPGLWEDIAFGGGFSQQTYVQDHGEALYRRSMYTFWKRTCPPPSLQTFDAPEREFCMVRRSTTNTPLQALVLMNDPTYTEASRKFAERIMTEIAAEPKDRIRYAFRLALGRLPSNEEIRVLLGVHDDQLAKFRKEPAAATKLVSVGESPRNSKLDEAELAAWTGVTNVILNMDEMITKN